jgi:CubicO group peptidase (beta-lactamase class C family)
MIPPSVDGTMPRRDSLSNATRRRGLWVAAAILVALVLLVIAWVGWAAQAYSVEYVRRVLAYRQSDLGDYLEHFPHRALAASASPFRFQAAPETHRVEDAFKAAFGVQDPAAFLIGNGTQAFIVIRDDRVLLERYYNGFARDSMVTSFSVAKSFVSTLIGMAIERGYISGLDEPITTYLPELRARDARFDRITIRHLLTMSSGIDYRAYRWRLFDGDDPLSTYHPDQRAIRMDNTRIVAPPGQRFVYNKYHPQLLGMILERSMGMSVTAWTQQCLWTPLGMEFDGAWAIDSTTSGFEKMEAGLNARPIDFAKLGRLFLNRGQWDGARLISAEWVALATGVDPRGLAPTFSGATSYGLMWWVRPGGAGAPDFSAIGDHGQFVFVSPRNRIIIVRTGAEYGVPWEHWLAAFSNFADAVARE